MINLEISKKINAPREILWEAIVDPDLYRIWTSAFSPGSDFDGNWRLVVRLISFQKKAVHKMVWSQRLQKVVGLSLFPFAT